MAIADSIDKESTNFTINELRVHRLKDRDENDAYLMPYFLRTALQYFCTLIFITIDLAVALSYSLVHKYIKIIQSIKIHL